jgi:hypothetical protein
LQYPSKFTRIGIFGLKIYPSGNPGPRPNERQPIQVAIFGLGLSRRIIIKFATLKLGQQDHRGSL